MEISACDQLLAERACLFSDVPVKIFAEVFERTLQRLHGSGGKCTESISRPKVFGMELQQFDVFGAALSLVDCTQYFFDPGDSLPARRAKSARLLCKEVLQVFYKSDRASLIVHHDHRAGAKSAPDCSHRSIIHLNIEVLF